MNNTEDSSLYEGTRGSVFQKIIINILKRANIKQKYIDEITNIKSMKLYDKAFTSSSFDDVNNYEIFEQLGDVTANKFIVHYMYKRFPQLKCPLGVKVVARLRINYGARQSFYKIGEELGFWELISASVEERSHKKKDLLEDCVESFIGVTEYLIDNHTTQGVGAIIVNKILESIFDNIKISLKYEDLYDGKTRLKELFDFEKTNLGQLKYRHVRDETTGIFTAEAYIIEKKNVKSKIIGVIGSGCASKLRDAEQKAAENGLKLLKQNGMCKNIPKEYSEFSKS